MSNTEKNGSAGETRQKTLSLIQRHKDKIRQYIRQKEIEQYIGNEVFCPVCESWYGSFAPYYGWFHQESENDGPAGTLETDKFECKTFSGSARCPSCGSLERQRLLWMYLRQMTDLFHKKEKRLLEISPDEYFFNAFNSNTHIDYYPCDINPGQEKFIQFNGRIQEADITRLEFADDYFDVILCCHVLEHISDDRLAMKELHRVMKKDGWGIFQVPVDYSRDITFEDFTITSAEEREKAFGQWDHVRWYGKDYIARLAAAGFNVSEISFITDFSVDDIRKYGLDVNERIYFCRK